LSDDGWTYTWENGRQLKSLNNASTSLSFKYNSDGIRTEKTVNGVTTKYTVFGDKDNFETTGSDKIHYSYDASGNLFSMNLNGTEYYYVRNAQGDITGLIDNAGNLVVSYTYDTWGKMISTTGSLAGTVGVKNPYRYRGYRYDTETGLYYLQSRYYNPDWGRFVNADDIGVITGSMGDLTDKNIFAFCDNNPVNRADNGGDFWHVIAAATAGSLISGVMDVVIQVTTTRRWDWKQTAIAAGTGAISGASAMIPGGVLLTTSLSVGINAALGAGAYAATEAINRRKVTTGGLIASTIAGAIGGLVGAKVRLKTTTALGKSAKATIDKGTKKVFSGIVNSAKGTIKRGYQYWDEGYALLNRYGWNAGVNSDIGSVTGMLSYQPYARATGGYAW